MPLNLPNLLTVSRIALAVGVMRLLFLEGFAPKLTALVLFLTASATDYVDGRLARMRGQITDFGKLMDPIADKVLVLGTFLAFVQLGLVDAWMVLVILARDLVVTGLRLHTAQSGVALEAGRSGKHKTVLQFAAILGILLYLAARESAQWDPAWNASSLHAIRTGMLFIVGITLWSGLRVLVKHAPR